MAYPMQQFMPQFMPQPQNINVTTSGQDGGMTMMMIPIFVIVFYFLYRRFIKTWWLQLNIKIPRTWIPDPTTLVSPWWNQYNMWHPSTWFITDNQIGSSWK